jgi:hypothetical protein
MFELSSDIYFVVYKLYYVGQNDNLRTRAWPINRDGGSLQRPVFMGFAPVSSIGFPELMADIVWAEDCGKSQVQKFVYYLYLYYWFSVGEGTLPLHHLIAQNTPNKKSTSITI